MEGTNQWLRIAALIAALLFALHGLLDVSGHRVGTAYAGLFLLGLALRRPLKKLAGPALIISFRLAGLLLLGTGMTWVIASYREIPLPGSIGADVERARATSTNVGRQYRETIQHANRGLGWAPLDWRLYFLRALGKIGTNAPVAEAVDDFRRARFLEPNWFEVPYQEGLAWMARQPILALTAWREALRRAGDQRPELYSRMLSAATQLNPEVNQMLEEFGAPSLSWPLSFSSAPRAKISIAPSITCSTAIRRSAVSRRSRNKNSSRFGRSAVIRAPCAIGRAKTRIARAGLAWDGKASGESRKVRGSGRPDQMVRREADSAAPATTGSIEDLEKAAVARPNDYGAGFSLFQQQMEQKRIDDALITVRRYTERADAPSYFHYLEAEAWAAKGNWERAWAAFEAYEKQLLQRGLRSG